MQFGHDALRHLGADAVEALERALRRGQIRDALEAVGDAAHTVTSDASVKLKPLINT